MDCNFLQIVPSALLVVENTGVPAGGEAAFVDVPFFSDFILLILAVT